MSLAVDVAQGVPQVALERLTLLQTAEVDWCGALCAALQVTDEELPSMYWPSNTGILFVPLLLQVPLDHL